MDLFLPLVATRLIYFVSVFLLFGAPLFWFYEVQLADRTNFPRSLCATLMMLRIAVPVVAISGVAWLAEILANMAGDFASVVDPQVLHLFFFSTQFGPVVAFRLVLFVLLLVVGILPLRHRPWFLILLGIAALLLVTQAWLGHAAEGGAGPTGALMIFAYAVHMLAAAAWVGGLPVLLIAFFEIRQQGEAEVGARAFEILSRYSLIGMIAVTLIVASGIANAGFRVAGSFGRLLGTDYGTVLAAKIGAVALMLALAYFNRFIAMPRLRRQAAASQQMGRLRASIAVELALAMLVLGMAAVLGITPPPQ